MPRIAVRKKSRILFFIHELALYASQIFIFFLVAVFASDFLKSEERLVDFSKARLNDGTGLEFIYVFIATFTVIGILKMLEEFISSRVIKDVLLDVVKEVPKIIYLFGSTATSVMIASALYLYQNPDPKTPLKGMVVVTIIFTAVIFIYGSTASYMLKRKSHILNEKKPNKPSKKDAASGASS